jgi:hypothetical protein
MGSVAPSRQMYLEPTSAFSTKPRNGSLMVSKSHDYSLKLIGSGSLFLLNNLQEKTPDFRRMELCTEFIHWITHELLNPVNNVSSFFNLVSMSMDSK